MLHDTKLSKRNSPKVFQNMGEDIELEKDLNNAAKLVARYREEIHDVLNSKEAEGIDDEKDLEKLKKSLEEKHNDLFKKEYGKSAGLMNFSDDNNQIEDFWKKIISAKWDHTKIDASGLASSSKKDALEGKIQPILEQLQFLRDNKDGKRQKWQLFGGKSTNMAEISGTLSDTKIQRLLNVKDEADVHDKLDDFINAVTSAKGNAFYIQHTKLDDLGDKKTSIRIAGYLYMVYKIIQENCLTNDLLGAINNILDNQIIPYELPKIKGIHNTEVELGYVVPEYDTLKALNDHTVKEFDLGSQKLSVAKQVFEQKLTAGYENGPITEHIEEYKLLQNSTDPKCPTTVQDAGGNVYTVSFVDAMGRTGDIYSTVIQSSPTQVDFRIETGGKQVKIGKIILDNKSGDAALRIEIDEEAAVNAAFLAEGLTVPTWPLDIQLPLKGIKKVNNGLDSCKAAITKPIKIKLEAGGGSGPVTVRDLTINAAVSDMGANVLREKVALEVGQEMEKEYAELPKGDVINRARFFFSRGKMKQKRIDERMKNLSGKAFSGDAVLDSQIENATDRHQIEKDNGLDTVQGVAVYENNVEINKLCKDYLDGIIDDAQFQNTFNNLLEVGTAKDLKDRLDNEKITHIGTNLLLKMKQQKAWKILIDAVEADLNSYVSGGAVETSYVDNMNKAIEDYIKMYQDNPAELLGKYNNYRLDPTKLDELRNYLSQQKAIMSLATNNIKIRLNILKGGRSAYQINNEKREKSVFYRAGRRMDDHPRWTAGLTAGSTVAIGLATGGLGAFWGALLPSAWMAAVVGGTNAAKKFTHHTKEQKIHEESLVTDNAAEKRRIADLVDTATNGHGWTKYKAKRQLALYDKTTQNEIMITNNITDNIMDSASNVSAVDDYQLRLNLIEGWARLKYYRTVGHNFLASDEKTKTEEDMNRLEKAIFVGLGRLGSTDPTDIESYTLPSRFGGGTVVKFSDTYDKIQKDFEETNKKFKKQRFDLSLRYGICTAGLSLGTALGMQYLTHSGVFAGKGTKAVDGFVQDPSSISSQFDLGKHELLDSGVRNEIYNGTQRAIAPAPDGCTINIHYGAGTDATPFAHGREITLKNLQDKVDFISKEIDGMNLGANADVFKKELADIRLGNGVGTNGYLQNMRHAEFLEQTAQALSDSGRAGDMVVQLNHDITGLDVVGTHLKDSSERVVNGLIEVSKEEIPGTKARTWGRWIMGAPTFFNTFEDRKAA